MKEFEATIFMEPVGKGRPRTTVKNGKAITYTPDPTAHAENLIRDELLKYAVKFEAHVPVRLRVTLYCSRPKSLPKSRTIPTSKPDYDNVAKLLGDAMEKFVYENDSQVTTALIRKRYVLPGQVPRVEIYMSEDVL